MFTICTLARVGGWGLINTEKLHFLDIGVYGQL